MLFGLLSSNKLNRCSNVAIIILTYVVVPLCHIVNLIDSMMPKKGQHYALHDRLPPDSGRLMPTLCDEII